MFVCPKIGRNSDPAALWIAPSTPPPPRSELLAAFTIVCFKKKVVTKTYDKENKKPVIKASICNGEQVAGFKDIHTGKIEEVMLIKNQADLTPVDIEGNAIDLIPLSIASCIELK